MLITHLLSIPLTIENTTLVLTGAVLALLAAGAGFTIKTTIVSNSKEKTSQGDPYKTVLCLALMHTVIMLVLVFRGFI